METFTNAAEELSEFSSESSGSLVESTIFLIKKALNEYKNIELAWSGADPILIHVASQAVTSPQDLRVFVINTGQLHPETLEYIKKMQRMYMFQLDMISPSVKAVEALVAEVGEYGIFESQDRRQRCCQVRKVEPLRHKLRNIDAWMTGQRRYQNPATRSQLPVFQIDKKFSTPEHKLVKINPLAYWPEEFVQRYTKDNELPVNPLVLQGYTSIGCKPCTQPGNSRDETRFPWENNTECQGECGIHV